jgi:hypothetical protein
MPLMQKLIHITIIVILFFCLPNQTNAQPFTLDDRINPQELKLEDYKKDDAKAKGRISSTAFMQDADTAYYWIQGISIYSPTFFTITASDPAADLKISLYKENWKQAHKTGEIKGKGKWNTNFKTEGDFGIQVITAKKPVRYALLVWVGDEVKVDIPSPFKNGAGTSGGGWIKKNMILLIVALAAIAIIGFLLFKLKKAKK